MLANGTKSAVNSSTAAVPLLQRDLGGARAAFTTRDAGASESAHKAKGNISTSPSGAPVRNAEPHVQGGEFVKLIVFGGLDGILTSFAIVAGAAGVGLGVKAVLAIGISNVLADALAMGVGEYLSTKSEHEYITEEHARESWEFKNFPEGEVAESRRRPRARARRWSRPASSPCPSHPSSPPPRPSLRAAPCGGCSGRDLRGPRHVAGRRASGHRADEQISRIFR